MSRSALFLAAMLILRAVAFAQTWSTEYFNATNGYGPANSSLSDTPTNVPSSFRWQTTDPNQADGMFYRIGWTTGLATSGNKSVLFGGYNAAVDAGYWPGITNPVLYRNFTNPVTQTSPAVVVSFDLGILPTTDGVFTNKDKFGFEFLKSAGSSSLAKFVFNPSAAANSNGLRLQWAKNGTNVVGDGVTFQNLDIQYSGLYRMTATISGNSFEMSIVGLATQTNGSGTITNYAIVSSNWVVKNGLLSGSTTAQDFDRFAINWDLSSGNTNQPGGNYMILNTASVTTTAPVLPTNKVIYTQQIDYLSNVFTNGGGFFNSSTNEMGMWANLGTNKQSAVWRNVSTSGATGGSAKSLQVGDVFTITVYATAAYGNMGFSLNAAGTQGISYANRTNGSRLFVQEDGMTGSWYVGNGSGNNTSLGYNVGTTGRNYTFKVYITSLTTANVELSVDGGAVNNRIMNATLGGSSGANINAWSMYLQDNWNGSAYTDIIWKQTTTLENLGYVNLGYYATNGQTVTPGIIQNGLAADSATAISTNSVNIGGDFGSKVVVNQTNTYGGTTTVNSNATALAANSGAFGTNGAVTVRSGGRVQLSNNITLSRDLILNGDGLVGTYSGALQNVSGDNTWAGGISNVVGARINSDAGLLTLSGNITNGANQSLYIGGAGSTTISGTITGDKTTVNGALFKNDGGTLTLSANNSGLTGLIRLQGGTISIANANSLGSGALEIGSGPTVARLLVTSNTTRSAVLAVADSSTAGVIEVASGQTFTQSGSLMQTNGSTSTTKISKAGAGTLTLSGDNTFAGSLAVSNGTLNLASASGAAARSVASIAVSSGASLHVSQSNQINDLAAISLEGGMIERGNGISETLGDLSLASASRIDFGTGAIGSLRFGRYIPAEKLSVSNFQPGDTLVFASDLSSYLPETNRGPFASQYFYFDGGFSTDWDGSKFTVTAASSSSGIAFLDNWNSWTGGTEGSLFLAGGYLRVVGGPAVVGGKALFASPHVQDTTRTWYIRSGSASGPIVQTVTYRAPDGWSITLDPGLYYFSPGATAMPNLTGAAIDTNLGFANYLNKTVSAAYATNGQAITFSIYPLFPSSELLSSVRVIDPVPAGTSYVTNSAAGTGGTFGPYSSLADVPGEQAADNADPLNPVPGITNTLTVSTNFLRVGTNTLTVTMNVRASTNLPVVTPGELTTGGVGTSAVSTPSFTVISGPTPASTNVTTANGANFTWVVRPDNPGEYIFVAGATDSANNSIPNGSSRSVLAVEGGGPDVISWTIGNNSSPGGGETNLTGNPAGIYAFGGGTNTFRTYGIGSANWSSLSNAPTNTADSADTTFATNSNLIYVTRGSGFQNFYSFNITNNTWTNLANVGSVLAAGSSIVYLNNGGTNFVYASVGNGISFRRYNISANSWAALTGASQSMRAGSKLVTDGTNIFATAGGSTASFMRYNVASNSWTALANVTGAVGAGGGAAYAGTNIYVLRGAGTANLYRYNSASNTWTTLSNAPGNVNAGGKMTTDGTNLFVFQGATNRFWRYNVSSSNWSVLTAFPTNTTNGSTLTYAPQLGAVSARYSSLSATPALGGTNTTATVTLYLGSTALATNVTPPTNLTVSTANGASATKLSGPTPSSANITNTNGTVNFTYTYAVNPGSQSGSVTFSGGGTADGGISFPTATANSVLVAPTLTFQATVTNTNSAITNNAILADNGTVIGSIPSNDTFTATGGSIGDPAWEAPYISPEFVGANFIPDFAVVVPVSDRASATIPSTPGSGVSVDVFNGVGGGSGSLDSGVPYPATLDGLTPSGRTLSPVVDFPSPGQVVTVGNNFDLFFANTTTPPEQVSGIQARNFSLKVQALLKVDDSLDLDPGRAGIQLVLRVASDDGYHLKIGDTTLGFAGDRAFSSSSHFVTFEQPGLYPLILLFAANAIGQSGLELSWTRGSSSVTEIIPQSYLYQSDVVVDQAVTFEEIAAGTVPGDNYLAKGVRFSTTAGLQATSAEADFVPISSPAVLGDPARPPTGPGEVSMQFVVPSTTTNAVTEFVSFYVIDAEGVGASVKAFDPAGNQIFAQTCNEGGRSQTLVEISNPYISRVDVKLGDATEKSAIDQVTFRTPHSVSPSLSLSLQEPSYVEGSSLSGGASLAKAWYEDLALSFSTEPAGRVGGSSNVVIPAGQTNVSFSLPIVRDGIQSASSQVTLKAVAGTSKEATTSFTLKDADWPDLAVTNLTVDPETLVSSANFTVRWQTKNNGLYPVTMTFSDRVIVRNTTTGQTLVNQLVAYNPAAGGNGPIGAGESRQRQLAAQLPNGLAGVGDLQIEVIADASGSVAEYAPTYDAEANNTALLTAASTIAPYPDLQVTSVTVQPAPPLSGIQATGTAVVNWTLTNTGNAAVQTSFADRLVVRNKATGQVLFNRLVSYDPATLGNGQIAPGESRTRTEQFALPAGLSAVGELEFNVTANAGSSPIFEYNDQGTAGTNNAASTTVVSTQEKQGPTVSNLKFNGQTFTDGLAATGSGPVSLDVSDLSGVGRIDFFVRAPGAASDTLLGSDSAAPYSMSWNAENTETDGAYSFLVRAYDTYGNITEVRRTLNLALAVPPVPTITAPVNGAVLARSSTTVTGKTQSGRQVTVFLNGTPDAALASSDASGNYTKPLNLADGTNVIEAAVSNRAGFSAKAAVTVEVDRSVPSAPTAVTAVSSANGVIQLSWARPTGAIAGYNVYRSTAPFTDSAAATKVNTSLLTSTTLNNTPPADGVYYYRVTAVNTAQTEGEPSAQVTASSDRTAPSASIQYTPRGAYDGDTEQFGAGPVDVTVTVSESLAATPFLSLSPPGASPLVIDLKRVSDTNFTGNFVITSSVPSGQAFASISARDNAGNRGTAITAGGSILIDTAGPKVASLDIQPSRSVRNDPLQPVTVVLTARLDQPVKAGTAPKFFYKLSRTVTSKTEIADVVAGADPLVYTISLPLPANAGSTPESLDIFFEAVDALGNTGTAIDAQSSFQVYQNELPGLVAPAALTAQGKPAGEILLGWSAVEGAARYQIYRRVAQTGEFAPLTSSVALTYTDLPTTDGSYEYRVAAVREENGQTSTGVPGNIVSALSDRVPPAPPSNVRLSLVSRGVQVDWDHSPSFISEALTYSIYRNAPLPAEPQLAGAKIPGNRATDAAPSPQKPNYYLVAVDSVGNQSSATAWAYLNIDLLPVASLIVTRTDDTDPVVRWSQMSSGLAGYDIYWSQGETKTKLNTEGRIPSQTTSFTDSTYSSSSDRTYTVVTIDNNGKESLGRSLTLPRISCGLPSDATVARGVMNRLTYTVRNDSAARIDNARIIAVFGGKEHVSETFSIEQGATGEIPVVVGGYAELTGDSAPLETRLLIAPNPGEQVFIIRNSSVRLTSGSIGVDLMPGEFTAGGSGQARFSITNSSAEDIEITTAAASGSQDSPEFRLSLLDSEGNVLATQPVRIATGPQVVLLPNKRIVLKLAAGQSFTSEPVTIAVPPNAPARMVLRLEIDKIYYHQGQADEVVLGGLQTRRDVTSVQTSYSVAVASVTPAESNGDVPVVIAGQATARLGGVPMPNARLKLFIVRDGFESVREIFTDSAGRFSYEYVPAANEAGGLYKVRAVHPDITDRTPQASFVIRRVTVSPTEAILRSVKNYVQPVSVRAQTGEGVTVNNLRIQYLAEDQDGGVAIPGISVTPDAPVSKLEPGKTAQLGARITASLDAPSSGVLLLRVSSDESGAGGWQKIKIDYQFGPPSARLTASPQAVNTGVHPEDPSKPANGVAEEVTFTNTGLIAAGDVQFALLRDDGGVAPTWASLIVGAGTSLEVGESRTVTLSFQPGAAVPPGQYAFTLRAQSADGSRTDVPVLVAVTPSGEGNVEFRVINPFTEFDANGAVKVGLAGASVQVQNEDVTSIERTLTTDNLGGAFFENLPAGTYKYRINANKHVTSSGRFWIRPGATATQTVQMQYNPVTIEWSVVPVTIQDRYDVVLQTTFETDVPVPVIVVEPGVINLPALARGDILNGEFTISNRGLVRAENLKLPIPQTDSRIKIELPAELPTSIGAGQTIRIPYRVTALADLGKSNSVTEPQPAPMAMKVAVNSLSVASATAAASSGEGDCIRVNIRVPVTYTYECSNGLPFSVETALYFYSLQGNCGSGVPGQPTDWQLVFGDNWGNGNNGSGTPPKPKPPGSAGADCWPVDVRYGDPEVTYDNLSESFLTKVGCSVNTLTRQFETDVVDLSVPVPGRPGESVQVMRRYRDGGWRFFDLIEFDPAERAGPYTQLYWQNFKFFADGAIDNGRQRFRSGNTVITVDQSSTLARFRLSSANNSWAVFDADGNMRSFGRNNYTYATLNYAANGKVVSVLAGDGPQVLLTYHWDQNGRLDYAEDHSGRKVDYTWETLFNGAVDLSKVVGPDGSETNYTYEGYSRPQPSGGSVPASRITRITDSTGKTHYFTYSGALAVKSVLDEQGRGEFFEFSRDSQTQITYGSVRSTSGRVDEKWFYDDGELREWRINGLLAKKVERDEGTRTWITTDADGYQWAEIRDEKGRTTKTVNPDGTSRSLEYDPQTGRLVRAQNERGVASTIQYDSRGNVMQITGAAGTSVQREVQMDFSNEDKLRSVQLPGDGARAGARIDLSYDTQGDLKTVAGPINGSSAEILQRDVLGNVTESRDPLGQIWKTSYDKMNRPATVTDPRPGNKQTKFTFDDFNNLTEVTTASQRKVAFDYDINNSLVSVVGPDGASSSNEFDSGGRLAKTTDASGRSVSNEYDAFDRVVKTRDQEGNEITFTYATGSASSRPISVKFPTFTRSITYNFRNQPVSTTDTFPSGSSLTTKYTYYPTGELESGEDASGRVTRYERDELGRVTEVSSPGPDNTRLTSRISYDAAGNARTFTNPNGQVWNYEYDVAGQLTAEVTPLGKRTQFACNALGNLTTIIRPDGARIERNFDAIGMVTLVRECAPDGALAKTVSYTRDDDGRVTGYTESLPGVSGGYSSADYDYDAAGRVKTETVRYKMTDGSILSSVVSYTYYANGLLQSYTSPSGTVTTYTYDQANRLIGTSVDGVGQFIVSGYQFGAMTGMALPGGSSKSFEYDGYQRPTRLTSRDPSGQTISDISVTRDNAGNIISRDTGQGAASFNYDPADRLIAGQSGSYTYDANGNRRTDSATGAALWQYDADDRLINDGTNIYEYDDNGSLKRKTTPEGVWTFSYDHDGRLLQVIKPGSQTIEYRYDPAGRRIAKIVGGVATYYRYSVFGVCAEYSDSGQLSREYGYAANAANGAAPLYLRENRQNYFYHTDHLGTPWKLTNESGAVVWSATYSDFGKATITSSLVTNNWRSPGQYLDEETGLHYNYHRYYCSETGRYVTRDPVSDGTNYYAYAWCNPLGFTDPNGLRAVSQIRQNVFSSARRVISGINRNLQDLWAGFNEGYAGSVSANSSNSTAALFGRQLGAMKSGFDYGYGGGEQILANTFSFGLSDRFGLTNSEQYQGTEFEWSRASATVARGTLLAAGGLSAAGAASGGAVASFGTNVTGSMTVEAISLSQMAFTSATAVTSVAFAGKSDDMGIAEGLLAYTGAAAQGYGYDEQNAIAPQLRKGGLVLDTAFGLMAPHMQADPASGFDLTISILETQESVSKFN